MRPAKNALSEATMTAWLHLLKKTLIRYPLQEEDVVTIGELENVEPKLRQEIDRWIDCNRQGQLHESGDLAARAPGKDWPATAESMIGLFRMDNLHACALDVMHRGVAGDIAEIGVWRAGAGIFLRAILRAFDDRRRKIWLADSFQGLPRPDADRYPADQNDEHWKATELAVSLDSVKQNFERYGLLDEQDRFLVGWFRDTLPAAPIRKLALLHVDCDMYESTILALRHLYPKVSQGGYVIVDDYGAIPSCRQAVDDFRREFQIQGELQQVDWTGVFWQV